jgi:hypothetical protein
MYVFGGLFAPLAGVGGNNTAVPMALVVISCGAGAALSLRTLAPRMSRERLESVQVEAESVPVEA